jgi:hypothetical protein
VRTNDVDFRTLSIEYRDSPVCYSFGVIRNADDPTESFVIGIMNRCRKWITENRRCVSERNGVRPYIELCLFRVPLELHFGRLIFWCSDCLSDSPVIPRFNQAVTDISMRKLPTVEDQARRAGTTLAGAGKPRLADPIEIKGPEGRHTMSTYGIQYAHEAADGRVCLPEALRVTTLAGCGVASTC